MTSTHSMRVVLEVSAPINVIRGSNCFVVLRQVHSDLNVPSEQLARSGLQEPWCRVAESFPALLDISIGKDADLSFDCNLGLFCYFGSPHAPLIDAILLYWVELPVRQLVNCGSFRKLWLGFPDHKQKSWAPPARPTVLEEALRQARQPHESHIGRFAIIVHTVAPMRVNASSKLTVITGALAAALQYFACAAGIVASLVSSFQTRANSHIQVHQSIEEQAHQDSINTTVLTLPIILDRVVLFGCRRVGKTLASVSRHMHHAWDSIEIRFPTPQIYVMGAVDVTNEDTATLNPSAVFDCDRHTWSPGIELPRVRASPYATVVDGTVYLLVGEREVRGKRWDRAVCDGARRLLRQEANGSLVELNPLPDGRRKCGLAVVDSKLFVVGGAISGSQDMNMELLAVTYCYCPQTDTWQDCAPLLTLRSNLAVAACDGHVYAIGGCSSTTQTANERYSPISNSWEPRSPISSPRSHCATAVIDQNIYVLGGRCFPISFLATVLVYHTATDRWSPVASMLVARADFTAVVIDGFIFAIGGDKGSRSESKVQTIERYSPQEDSWTMVDAIPFNSYNHSAVLACLPKIRGDDFHC